MPHLIPGKNIVVVMGHDVPVRYSPSKRPLDVEVTITRLFLMDNRLSRTDVPRLLKNFGIDPGSRIVYDEDTLCDSFVILGKYIGDTTDDNETRDASWDLNLLSIYSSG